MYVRSRYDDFSGTVKTASLGEANADWNKEKQHTEQDEAIVVHVACTVHVALLVLPVEVRAFEFLASQELHTVSGEKWTVGCVIRRY